MTNDQPNEPANNLDDRLEAEIQAALGDMSVEDMLDYGTDDRPVAKTAGRGRAPQREFKSGIVMNVHGNDVYVEFGPKSQGVCPLSQFEEPPAVGARLDFVVDRFDEADGLLMLSREGAVRKADWEALEVGQIVEGRCTGTNKGGLEVELAKHKAFMPAGQVDIRHIEDLDVFIGEKMPCEIIELDRQRGRLVVSRRRPLEADRERRREQLMGQLEVGTTLPATISSIKDFGAFADLGGVDGLIHISDLSHSRVKHPSDVVKVGDEVNVKILKIDTEQQPPRIGLGLKQTLADPFAESAAALEVGAIVTGRVTKLMDFGAFVELSPGVEGLIHISELSPERVQNVAKVIKADEIVTVKILSVDPGQRRIGLSRKAAMAAEESDTFSRDEDPEVRRMKAQLSKKFGDNLKGGLG